MEKIPFSEIIGLDELCKSLGMELADEYKNTESKEEHDIEKKHKKEQNTEKKNKKVRQVKSDDSRNKKCVDHLGKEYNSVKEMCDAWGVSYDIFYTRRKRGYSLESSLLKKEDHNKKGNNLSYSRLKTPCVDHLGKEYSSIKEMCDVWGVLPATFYIRKKNGHSIEECLTGVPKNVKVARVYLDHKGLEYSSLEDLCNTYNVTVSMYRKRKYAGWDLEKILTTPVTKEVRDHEGNVFNTVNEMCVYWNTDYMVYYRLKNSGHTLEECLTYRAHKKKKSNTNVVDHTGKEFGSIKEMCDYYTFYNRKRKGYTLEECLLGKKQIG